VETDTQTDRHTHTDTQTKYSNPRCAGAPRVNYTPGRGKIVPHNVIN